MLPIPVVHSPSTQAACCNEDPEHEPEHCRLRTLMQSMLHEDHDPHGDQEPMYTVKLGLSIEATIVIFILGNLL